MNSNMEKMIELVSKKLNISSDKLKSALEKGDVDGMLGNMRKEDAERLKEVMNNSAVKDKLMNSPEAVSIMKKMQK